MKKLVALSVISLVLAGCVNPGKASVQPKQLQNHRFVLENVDGKAVKTTTTQPEISFSALPEISLLNNITVSGAMCNRFNGQEIVRRRAEGQNAGNDPKIMYRPTA
jgi:heat shock protein HslJ